MDFSMIYCTHCLRKLASQQALDFKDGGVRLFLPVMDSFQRAFYVYLNIGEKDLSELCAIEEKGAVDLWPLVEILHVEEGWWPDPERMEIIRGFYGAATHQTKHNVKIAA